MYLSWDQLSEFYVYSWYRSCLIPSDVGFFHVSGECADYVINLQNIDYVEIQTSSVGFNPLNEYTTYGHTYYGYQSQSPIFTECIIAVPGNFDCASSFHEDDYIVKWIGQTFDGAYLSATKRFLFFYNGYYDVQLSFNGYNDIIERIFVLGASSVNEWDNFY